MTENLAAHSRAVGRLLLLYAFVGGAVSFIAWPLDWPRLAAWDDSGIAIQPNTTIAVMASALALLLPDKRTSLVKAFLSALVFVIGAGALLQVFTGLSFELMNTLLMFDRTWGREGVISPGRIGPPGSLCWTLVGAALLIITLREDSRARRWVPILAIVCFSIATLSLMGYLFRVDKLFSLPHLTIIALQTSTFIAAISVALIIAIPEHAPMRWMLADGATGSLARRAVPAVLLGPFLIGSIRLAGEAYGWYDTRFGIALFVLMLTALLMSVLAWCLSVVSRHERLQLETATRLRKTLESITDGFIGVDREWKYTYVNEEAARLMRKCGEELVGHRVLDVFPDLRDSPGFLALQRAATERTTVEYEEYDPIVEKWFFYKAYPADDGGLSIYFHDVTERKKSSEALEVDHAALTRLQMLSTQLMHQGELNVLLGEVLDAAIEFGRTDKGNIQLYDPASDVLNIGVHRGLGRPFVEHFANKACDSICGAAARINGRVIVEDVVRMPELEGTEDLEVLVDDDIRAVQSTPLTSRSGELLGVLNTHFRRPHRPSDRELKFLDILARLAADVIERSRAEQALRDADRHKDEFLAMLAHELRGPLAPMKNSLDALGRAKGTPGVIERATAIMQRQVGQMTRLVDDLLDLSRVASDKIVLKKERIELQEAVQHAIESCAPTIERFGHLLSVDMPADPIFLNADSSRLVQVFANLLQNACKYTPPHGRLHVSVKQLGHQSVLRFQDNGIGIPADKLGSIFSMFGQTGRKQEAEHGGLGIGLYLVKRLVELHGGSVSAASEGSDRGSEFVVRLPIILADAPIENLASMDLESALKSVQSQLRSLDGD